MKKLLVALALVLGLAGSARADLYPPLRVQSGGSNLPIRFKLNFTAGGCVDNASAHSTDCTISAATGNFSFSGNVMDLTGSGAMSLGTTVATSGQIGKTWDGSSATGHIKWDAGGVYLGSHNDVGNDDTFQVQNGEQDHIVSAVRVLQLLASGSTFTGTVTLGNSAQASLGTPANGTLLYCTDCTVANPCGSGGSGALAKRINGAWVCN